ncbi:hypothetical protein GF380_01670 [Candidatus Uhrbacteria bacterium]|nr:hypothetical protein [Candidatus Uhrbacteria bacterium]
MSTITATFTSPTITATFANLPIANVWSAKTTQALSADDTIAVAHAAISLVPVEGSGGAVTLTSTPSLQTSGIGTWHIAIVIGTSDTNTVTVQDATNQGGSALHLQYARNCTLGKNDCLGLMFNATDSVWIELFRSENY